jgi:hypothetical protein
VIRQLFCVALFTISASVAIATPSPTLQIGPSALVGDPFLRQFGIQGTATVPLTDHYGVLFGTGIYFGHGQDAWSPLTKQLVEKNKVSPDMSGLGLSGYSALYVEPAHFSDGDLSASIGAYAGVGFVNTQDDLEALGDDSLEAQATANETHPAGIWGMYTDLYFTPTTHMRLRAHQINYVEVIASKTLEVKTSLFLGAEIGFALPNGQRR